jgi:hypothetical protein
MFAAFHFIARLLIVIHILLRPLFHNPLVASLQDAPPADLTGLAVQFGALLGVAALVAALINAGKTFGIVKDGDAPKWSLGLNGLGFAALLVTRLFAPQVDPAVADQVAGQAAQILILVLGLVSQFGFAKLANNGLRGLPVIGKSHRLELEKRTPFLPADHAPITEHKPLN